MPSSSSPNSDTTEVTNAQHARLRAWWDMGSGGAFVYNELRRVSPDRWNEALDHLPDDDGPEPVPPPDRPPARVVDLPEVLALRALLMDRRVAFDTVERWIRALTQTTRMLEYERPLIWTADDVAKRLVQIANGSEGSTWSTLEVVRELWAWHPDRPFIDKQSERLLCWLESLLLIHDGGAS